MNAYQSDLVRIWRQGECVAEHRRCEEPHALVRDPRHFAGLFRRAGDLDSTATATGEGAYGGDRSLADYARIVEGSPR